MRKVIILSFLTVIFAQNKTLELQDVMGGTFRYDRIGSYNFILKSVINRIYFKKIITKVIRIF